MTFLIEIVTRIWYNSLLQSPAGGGRGQEPDRLHPPDSIDSRFLHETSRKYESEDFVVYLLGDDDDDRE